jgi:hypothetical protein
LISYRPLSSTGNDVSAAECTQLSLCFFMLRFSRQLTLVTAMSIASFAIILSTDMSVADDQVAEKDASSSDKTTDDGAAAELVAQQREAHWQSGGWKMVQRFCVDCHNAEYQEAEIDLSPL